jgi:hypothetical protein
MVYVSLVAEVSKLVAEVAKLVAEVAKLVAEVAKLVAEFMYLFLFMVYVSFSIYGLCVFFYFIFYIYTAHVVFPFFLSAQSLGCNRINPTIALALH